MLEVCCVCLGSLSLTLLLSVSKFRSQRIRVVYHNRFDSVGKSSVID